MAEHKPDLALVAKSRRRPATLQYTPARTDKCRYRVGADGRVTLDLPGGFLKKERSVELNEASSFLWLLVDGRNTIDDLCNRFHTEFPSVKDPQPKVLRCLSAWRADGLIAY